MPGLDELQDQKGVFLARLQRWPEPRLRARPAPGQWSAIEIVDHMVRTEGAILAAAKAGLQHPHRIALTDTLRTRFLDSVFRSDRKVKVPKTVPEVLPGSNLVFPAVIDRWNACREDLGRLLATTPDSELRKGLFKHPVGGWMGMPQGMDFFSAHVVHHAYQLSRLEQTLPAG